jgi:class 3 adenylate cyclase
MAELPTGTVTFLFTDLEGSTRLWESDREAMAAAVARHDALLEDAIGRHGGVVFSHMGDGMAAAFGTAPNAVAAAIDAQLALSYEAWGVTGPLRARMGLHTGEGRVIGDQYESHTLNRCARLMAVAHGGQLVISGSTAALVVGELPEGVDLIDLGLMYLAHPRPGQPHSFEG